MEKNDLITFRKFAQIEHAEELKGILQENEIVCDIKKHEGGLDPTFQGAIETFKFEVRIQEEDLEKVESLLEKMSDAELEDIDPAYHLFQFSNEELVDILVKRDEWNEFDYVLSRKILKDRGIKIDEEKLKEDHLAHQKKLAEPSGGQTGWIVFGYLFACLGGLLGIMIGHFLWKGKTVLPNGKKVPAYTDSIRKHGKQIFFFGLFMFLIVMIIRVFIWIENH